ncbi:hypothetical protein PR048_001810 [Dryococelus australis]|uniref:RING-type domain-containing protein n=1 Tax=Dryococelus australis TaxID=614101 RepID=A0ABQ9IJG2_9NEOP|nr:hypothetical protein PR048_001810 [Dryococelus australis]
MASGHGQSSGTASTSTTPQRVRPLKRQHSTVMNGVDFASEDKYFLCPICLDVIEAAHMTECGHTFCYGCITKSLETNGHCPKCSVAVEGMEHVYPNVLLNQLISDYKSRILGIRDLKLKGKIGDQIQGPADGLRNLVASKSQNLSLPDINLILEVLTQRKHLLEAESCVAQNKLLYEFLKHLLQQKEEQLTQLTKEVELIKRDMEEVEGILRDVQNKCPKLDEALGPTLVSENVKKEAVAGSSDGQPKEVIGSGDGAAVSDGSDVQKNEIIASFSMRRKRMHAHFDDFVQCYFSTRSKELVFGCVDKTADSSRFSTGSGLDMFRENLVKFSRYNTLRPLATLNYSSDIFNSSTIVSSIEFDKDNEFFAIAGVTKRIKVFDYGIVIRDAVDIHYPCVEMTSNSKISCISWNSYHKGTLASSDYEGTITVWDAVTGQRTKTFQEHEKRCWSVDFNDVDTRLIASGSDDARVKLWSLNIDHSIATLEVKANVCCVKFNPRSSCHLAFGSADHCVHYYDLRIMKEALSIFKGHRKAVSYVKFLNKEEIVSASTDSQLKMWNINNPHCLRSFVGHINEKNFVGLATDGDYIACGSENNALYVYYKGLTKQLFNFKFEPVRSVVEVERKEDDVNEFVSAVCWRQHSNVVVAANSQGIIKVLELV